MRYTSQNEIGSSRRGECDEALDAGRHDFLLRIGEVDRRLDRGVFEQEYQRGVAATGYRHQRRQMSKTTIASVNFSDFGGGVRIFSLSLPC